MHGFGLYSWPNADKLYIGEYKHDLKDGYGIYKMSKDKIYMGFWKNGKGHGLGTVQIN